MAEEPDNIIPVYLRRLDAKIDRMTDDVHDLRDRVGSLEGGQAAILRELSRLAETDARLQASMDQMRDRMARIERRIDLSDQPNL